MPQIIDIPGMGQVEFPDGMTDDQIVSAIKASASPQTKSSTNPSLIDVATGPATMGDWARGRANAAKDLATPEYWKGMADNLTNPLPAVPRNAQGNIALSQGNGAELSSDEKNSVMGLALYGVPASSMSKVARAAIVPKKTGADIVKQQTLDMAGQAGYSVPRSNIQQTFLTNLGERLGGKQAIEATAQIKNQPITNKLAAKALGLSDDVAITPDVLKGIRDEAGKAYRVVSNLGTLTADKSYMSALKDISTKFSGASKDFPELASQEVAKLTQALAKKTISADGAVEMIKNLRSQAGNNLGPMATAQGKLLGKAQRAAADAMEDLIERNIAPVLGNEVLGSYKSARQLIAKTHTVEKALNEGTGNVNAAELAKALRKGVPLSNELKQIARFSQAFPRISREPIGAPASGGLFEPMVYGTAGAMSAGPAGLAAAAVPIIGKPVARHLMTTVPKQPNMMGNMASNRNDAMSRLVASLQQSGLLGE